MTPGPRETIRACVFDAYGTLLDLSSSTGPVVAELGPGGPRLLSLWRSKQLEYTWLRSLMAVHADFDRVTEEALDCVLQPEPPATRRLREPLLAAFRTLRCYPEVPALLARLRGAGLPVSVLSNGTTATLEAAFSAAGVRDRLDAIHSVEAVGIFKPAPQVYALAAGPPDVPRAATLFVSGNGWDVAGAASFGFTTAWVNRAGAPAERLPVGPDVTVESLAALPEWLGLGPLDPTRP